jgi:ParB-like chromosome segregation protein Spo0J
MIARSRGANRPGPKHATSHKQRRDSPPKVTHVKDLRADPQNRRTHNPRNVGMVVDALHAVGAARSIVIDEHNVVMAGNGVVEGAMEAGIHKVHVVEADGSTLIAVRRVGLTEEQKRVLAMYDNRTAELADWNVEQLQLDAAGELTLEPWFSEREQVTLGVKPAATDGVVSITEQYQVLVTCEGETNQASLLERLTAEGYTCRALMS